jgi:hypothetical protein
VRQPTHDDTPICASLGLKVSLKLAVLVVALTSVAAVVIVRGQTRQEPRVN